MKGPVYWTFALLKFKFINQARKIMGNYFMLPRYPIWGKDELLLQTPKSNYSLSNLDQLFLDMGVTDGMYFTFCHRQ